MEQVRGRRWAVLSLGLGLAPFFGQILLGLGTMALVRADHSASPAEILRRGAAIVLVVEALCLACSVGATVIGFRYRSRLAGFVAMLLGLCYLSISAVIVWSGVDRVIFASEPSWMTSVQIAVPNLVLIGAGAAVLLWVIKRRRHPA